jgi:transcriptional regulator with XRE-family HTH domain
MEERIKMGKKIRNIRTSKGLSLAQVAEKISKTTSYLSQVERGLAEPSITALREISKALDVPMFYFLMDNKKNRCIVRKDERETLNFPGSHSTFELLTPDLNHEMEVIRIELEPGASTYDEPSSHKGEEFILVLNGKMEIQIDSEFHVLNEGDSIYFLGSIPHKTTNISDTNLTFISAVTPPNF